MHGDHLKDNGCQFNRFHSRYTCYMFSYCFIYIPLTSRVRGPYGKWTEQTMLIRCLLYGFVDYSGKGTKSFDVLTGDRELKVRTATYQPGIGQSQHAKFVSHIIRGIKELYWKQ